MTSSASSPASSDANGCTTPRSSIHRATVTAAAAAAAAGAWKSVSRGLLERCADLTGDDPALVVLTAHTPGFGPDRLAGELAIAFRRSKHDVEAGDLGIRATSGAHLRLGAFARIIRE